MRYEGTAKWARGKVGLGVGFKEVEKMSIK